ncbi:unnamed protein product [Oikopleura dioica]|uniref:Uncharacterized protein n=1 Tax=Oikopleura dioica TaxID=34765 RepID=E4XQQ2_OIKDI|nr:unnamed protein product [Oikopleura dioica]
MHEKDDKGSCCIVPFHGDYFIINADKRIATVSHKLTLFKINQAGIFEKLSEDFPKISIAFGAGKICSRGIYQNKEERIIFCSSHESRGICHSYFIKDNRVVLTEIYNRPESTIVDLSQNERVIGLTLNDQLTTVKMRNDHSYSGTSISITSFVGREISGKHRWTHQEVNFPSTFRDETMSHANIQLLSAFSDNKGIIFVTNNNLLTNFGQINTIRFHRIFQNTWFFLGRYEFSRKNKAILFPDVFMFQGQFFLVEDVRKCTKGIPSFDYYCHEEIILPPKIYLLDHETDKFVEQKLDINYQGFDFFLMSV